MASLSEKYILYKVSAINNPMFTRCPRKTLVTTTPSSFTFFFICRITALYSSQVPQPTPMENWPKNTLQFGDHLQVFQIDLCRNRTHGFVCLTNQWGQLKHKSIWNANGAAGALWLFGAKQKLLVVKKTSSLYHSRHSYGPGTLIGIDFHPETAEK